MSAPNIDANTPRSQGLYDVATRRNDIIYVSGMTPRKAGALIHTGQIDPDKSIDEYSQAVRQAAGNALAAAATQLREGEIICEVVSLTVYVNAPVGFNDHSRIADFASAYFRDNLGQKGVGSRTAIGVSSLPSNAPVELQVIVSVCLSG
ncbi:RidA family protein [Phyllobacterium endophyticum]|uniref:RidA family protein n=1 Tax=Phyllobacterium endophyticum TaxID=1149773 RepID=A0A2P7AKE7_9HYPH|nr:RidA family protein [Phyllobacterium endophyticum]MBB3237092.1 enamine deaminase RidA (YjgF/YER057c/UK114 family) [Phyllobacterium endophyticum]PSH54672.1 RidA family protein [Phyllobacterium endophyticum]TYR40561.1 RidA family protein [Phyllobacterium endophyticum]